MQAAVLREHGEPLDIQEYDVSTGGIAVVDPTPLLDIKPFVPALDVPSGADTGWLDASKSTIQSKQVDRQFL